MYLHYRCRLPHTKVNIIIIIIPRLFFSRLFFNDHHWDRKGLCQAICYLFEKLKLCFQLLNSKNDGPVLLFKTII